MLRHIRSAAKSSVMSFAMKHPIISGVVSLAGIGAIVSIATGSAKTKTNVPTTTAPPSVATTPATAPAVAS
jgi:hypothetical protein